MLQLREGVKKVLCDALAKHTGGSAETHALDVAAAVEQSIPKSIAGVIDACVQGKKAAPKTETKTKTK